MKHVLCVSIVIALSVASYSPVRAGLSVWYVDGRISLDTLQAGVPITIYILWDGNEFSECGFTTGSCNGYRLYSPSGTAFTSSGEWAPGIGDIYIIAANLFVSRWSGGGEDTVKFSCFRLVLPGIPNSFYGPAHIIHLDPFPQSAIGGEICIDSTWVQPSCPWMWSTEGCGTMIPSWSGPHCYIIGNCCADERGDMDASNSVDVSDLTYLVDYLFQQGPDPMCLEEADINGSGSTDVADLTYLVDYLFGGGPAPVACA